MKKILTIFLVTISTFAFSQEKTITGTVTSPDGQPALGVTIIIEGTNKGAITDFDGKYYIKGLPNQVIVFSSIGMETQKVTIGNQSTINITFEDSNEELDEIVVIGYGTVKKSDLTGSVSSVKAEDIEKVGAVNLDQALAGRAAGVVVTSSSGEPGGAASIQIRGISSLNGSEPLYIIDGVPMDNDLTPSIGVDDLTSADTSPLAMLNQADIESIEILKDASSTAIYGSRGASGVVLITTKQGKAGKGVINISQEYGISEVVRFVDVLDSNEYTILRSESRINSGLYTQEMDSLLVQALAGNLATNDWQKSIVRAGTQTNTNVSFSGGNKDMKYNISGGLLKTAGPVLNSGFKRLSTRARLSADVSKKVSIATNISFSRQEREQSSVNGAGGSFNRALVRSPLLGLANDDDDNVNDDDEDDPTFGFTPVTSILNTQNNTLMTQFTGSFNFKYSFNKSLFFNSAFSYQERHTAQRYYQFSRLDNVAGGRARTQDTRATRSTLSNTLNYNNKIGKSSLNIVLGQETVSSESEGIRVQNFGFPNDLLTYFTPGLATFNDPDTVTYSSDVLASFFGRINYTLNNKYLFTLTGRYDGASKFAENNKWAFFNAAAFAYKLSEENFLKDSKTISEIKLRLSYGTSGNQAIGPYASLDQYAGDLTPFGEAALPIYYQDQLPNSSLSWETTSQLDAGIDLGFFKNRLTATLEYYEKTTDNLLFTNLAIPAQSGFTTYTQNNGALETKGFEASFRARIIRGKRGKGFSWTMNGNVATGKTKVKELEFDNTFSGWDPGYISGGTQRLIIGEEIGAFYGYKTSGIAQFDNIVEFQGLSDQEQINVYNANPTASYNFVDGYEGGLPFNDADGNTPGVQVRPGDQLYDDLNEDGVVNDADRQVIGHAQPDVTLGISNTFSFGGFSISIFMDSQIGKDVHNHASLNLLSFVGNQSRTVALDRWTPENQGNTFPRMYQFSNANTVRYSDRYIEDGTFVRLQNITLNYNFPKKVTEQLNISGLNLYFSASNVAIWTKYTGFSPDASSRRGSLSLGHDQTGYPPSRLIRMGAKLKF